MPDEPTPDARTRVPHASAPCPDCGHEGHPVRRATIKALLQSPALRTLESGPYRFCAQASCPTVYYLDHATPRFGAADVRVEVWHKAAPGARTICYCFDENERDLHDEFALAGRSLAVERVRGHITAGRCACDIRNPRGICCLGDIMAAVARLGTPEQDW